jgi:hypothetical protein
VLFTRWNDIHLREKFRGYDAKGRTFKLGMSSNAQGFWEGHRRPGELSQIEINVLRLRLIIRRGKMTRKCCG